jgi:hypothetical protein|tara:strand:+ start:2189 stop:2305 length:117 start_codon:yes stop_codon:yes gene_type:complete
MLQGIASFVTLLVATAAMSSSSLVIAVDALWLHVGHWV